MHLDLFVMKINFKILSSLLLGSTLLAHSQPAEQYIHTGRSDWAPTNAPLINAISFINYGEFEADSIEIPYDFQNTLFYTNHNQMIGSVGFLFNLTKENGQRLPADTFYNVAEASIEVSEQSGVNDLFVDAYGFTAPSQLLVDSTNIINKGFLSAGANGIIRLRGNNIDLSRSALEIRPGQGSGLTLIEHPDTDNDTIIEIINDYNIYDNYWGIGSNQIVNVSGNLGMVPHPFTPNLVSEIQTPTHFVTAPFGGITYITQPLSYSLFDADAYVRMDEVTPTNWIREAIFVSGMNQGIVNNGTFFPSFQPTNYYSTLSVELRTTITNTIIGGEYSQRLYLDDMLASDTNFTLATNVASKPPIVTLVPANILVQRTPLFYPGFPANADLPPDFFFPITNIVEDDGNGTVTTIDAFMASPTVSNMYSAYGFNATNISRLNLESEGSLTNLTGRIEITATNGGSLNLDRTRIRGEGHVIIRTDNLAGSDRVNIDAQNVSFRLQSKTGNLKIEDLARDTVERLAGDVYTYAANWTNSLIMVTNIVGPDPEAEPDENGEIPVVTNTTSNTVTVGYNVFMVDAASLQTEFPVLVNHFEAFGDEVLVADSMTISETFLIDAETLTLDGGITFGQPLAVAGTNFFFGDLKDWDRNVVPNLKNFTNNGRLAVNRATFGEPALPTDRYNLIKTTGEINGTEQVYFTREFDASGSLSSQGRIRIQSEDASLSNLEVRAFGDVSLGAYNTKMLESVIETQGALFISPTNSLTDNGPDSGNLWAAVKGVHVLKKPAFGDLLGTRIELTTPRFALIENTWPGTIPAANVVDGFSNNLALGHLFMEIELSGTLSLKGIPGDGGPNALFVDYLEIGPNLAADFDGGLELGATSSNDSDEGLTIYFANSNLPIEGNNGLIKRFGGELEMVDGIVRQVGGNKIVWVPQFAGANSSTDVLRLSGETVQMNTALRESVVFDSDGDGLVNRDDFYPLDVRKVEITEPFPVSVSFLAGSNTASLEWEGVAGATYIIEFTEDLGTADQWQVLDTVEADSDGTQTYDDPVVDGSTTRYYRLRVD